MTALRSLCALLAGLSAGVSQAIVVNIDATHGFTYDGGGSDPAPVAGQHINPIGARIELALPAGEFTITNAYAEARPGAAFKAWSYNVGTSSWTWAFLVADAATDTVIFWNSAGDGGSADAVAALPAVQSYSRTLTLSAPTTLLFTLRDYYVPDNAGGISLNIAGAVPEPATHALWALGLAAVGLCAWRRGQLGSRDARAMRKP
jgi:hypothetical protein